MKRKQKGAALIIGIVLVFVATLVGLSSFNSAVNQERVSGNQRERAAQLLAAENQMARVGNTFSSVLEDLGSFDAKSIIDAMEAAIGTVEGHDIHFVDLKGGDENEILIEVRARPKGDSGREIVAIYKIERVRIPGTPPTPPNTPFKGFGSDAPAAISCFGGPCTITAGAGAGGHVDGTDWTLPVSPTCNGRAACLNASKTSNPARPAVFFPAGSTADRQGGGPHPNYVSGSTGITHGIDGVAVKTPAHYPTGNAPTGGTFFDANSHFALVTSGSSTFDSSRSNPKLHYVSSPPNPHTVSGNGNYAGVLIIDGTRLNLGGTTVFEGLILIRNCGVLNMHGTPFVYGAIVIDSDGCPANYEPFPANGTPNVRYSLEALALMDGIGGDGDDEGGSGGTPETFEFKSTLVSYNEFVRK